MGTKTITLDDLHQSASTMGIYGAWVENIGGELVGLHVKPHFAGPLFLVTLDDGHPEGDAWCVGLADGSDDSGMLPVTSDADQTMTDALAWMGGAR